MKKLIIIILIAAIVVGFGFLIKDKLFSRFLEIEKGVSDLLKETERKVFLPSPLVLEQDSPDSFLSKDEIIKITNVQRQKYGLAPLKENSRLDSSAEAKTEDLFLNQYFEHESPTGIDVSDLAQKAGYEFIILGENLAMGNFKDDEALVQAWMASPGHRENILNSSFTEIGVSVLKGEFQGKTTWIAVQHFALPLSACVSASESIKTTIEANEKEILRIEEILNSMKDNLNTRKDVREYNSLVLQHNNLVDKNKDLIEEYNRQVGIFNQCLTEAIQESN